jgi:hypothetical protein
MGLETQITTKLNHNLSFVPSFSFPRCLLWISCVCYCYNCVYHCYKIIFKLHAFKYWVSTFSSQIQQGMCHTAALPFTLRKYLKAKEELWKLKYFTMPKHNLHKNPLKETKSLQDIITLITNLKFQHKPNYHLSKILI